MDPLITLISDLVVKVGVPVAGVILFFTIISGWNQWARTKAEAHLSYQTEMMRSICNIVQSMASSVETICKVLDTICLTTHRIETMALVTEALQKARGAHDEITP